MTDLTPFAIYLIFTADDIKVLLLIGTVICLFVGGMACIFSVVEDEEAPAKFGKPIVIAGVIAAILIAVIPSTKTLVAMYGIPAAIDGAKNVATSEVGQKAYSAVNKLLDGYLNDKAKP